MTDKVLNLSRMARRLGVTQTWLRREAQAGRVPALRADSRFLFEPEAVEEAVAHRAARSNQEGPADA